jgi:alpha-tubulin suppressor-like RCC1 family protein
MHYNKLLTGGLVAALSTLAGAAYGSGHYLMGMGTSHYGELGTGFADYDTPDSSVQITNPKFVGAKKIIPAARPSDGFAIIGSDDSLCVYDDGYWGDDYSHWGQYGFVYATDVVDASFSFKYTGMYLNKEGQLTITSGGLATSPITVDDVVAFSADGDWYNGAYVTSDGSLYVFGTNSSCELGSADTSIEYDTPTKIADNVIDVDIALGCTFYLSNTNILYVMGNSGGTITGISDSSTPTPIATNVASMDGYNICVYYISTTGVLYSYSEGAATEIDTDVKNCLLVNGSGVYYLKTDNTLWYHSITSGASNTQIDSDVATYGIAYGVITYVKNDGSFWVRGLSYHEIEGFFTKYYPSCEFPTPILVADDVVSAALGREASFYITSDGTLYGMGDDTSSNYYHLGGIAESYVATPTQIATNIKAVASGGKASMYLTNDGSLYWMGYSSIKMTFPSGNIVTKQSYNKATLYEANMSVSAIAVGPDSVYLTTDGDLYTIAGSLIASGVSSIAANPYTMLYVTSSGDLYGYGYNDYGQLGGTPSSTKVTTPRLIASGVAAASVGYYNTLFITINGDLYGLGDNSYGELGNSDLTSLYNGKNAIIVTTPKLIANDVISFVAGGDPDILYVTSDGTLYACGTNWGGALGIGENHKVYSVDDSAQYLFDGVCQPTKVAENVISVVTFEDHTLYLTDDIKSPFWPSYTLGAKWADNLGWLDDTYFPWVWSYTYGEWFYVYDGASADTVGGYWVAWCKNDMSEYGWGYVFPDICWWRMASDGSSAYVYYGQ